MINSANRIADSFDDKIVAMMWKPAKNDVEAFIGEYLLQARRRVFSVDYKAYTYNRIWSPGRMFAKEQSKRTHCYERLISDMILSTKTLRKRNNTENTAYVVSDIGYITTRYSRYLESTIAGE